MDSSQLEIEESWQLGRCFELRYRLQLLKRLGEVVFQRPQSRVRRGFKLLRYFTEKRNMQVTVSKGVINQNLCVIGVDVGRPFVVNRFSKGLPSPLDSIDSD